MLIAIIVGGGVLGLAKLFPVSFWGFVGFFVMVLTITMILWINHKRTASARQLSYGPTTAEILNSQSTLATITVRGTYAQLMDVL